MQSITARKFSEMASGPQDNSGDASPASSSHWRHPPSFYCPISQQVMHNPVVLSDGHSYEQRHIERWLQEHSTSPVSNEELPNKVCFPNHALRNAIEEYFAQIFSSHRKAIRRSIQPDSKQSFSSNESLLCTIDALMQCSFLINADLNIECVLRQIMQEAKTLLGAEAASVFLVDTAKQELYSTVNSTGGELRIPITAGIAGHVASSGEPLIVTDVQNDPRFDRTLDVKTGFRTENMMCVPLKAKKGGVLGVVQLINKTGAGVFCASQASLRLIHNAEFTAQDLQFLNFFGSQVAAAVATSWGSLSEPPAEVVPEHSSQTWTDWLGCIARPSWRSSKEKLEEPNAISNDVVADDVHVNGGLESPSHGLNDDPTVSQSLSAASGSTDEQPQVSRSRRSISKQFISELLTVEAAVSEKVTTLLAEAFNGWQFDAFALAELTNNRPLSTLAMYLFEHLKLVEFFSLDRDKLANFFIEIERGYDDANSYHNRAHAASVMHAMHALLELGGINEVISTAFIPETEGGHLERLACLIAAAIHDYDHLGLSNDFLVRTDNARALRYNDQHVNEHHHVSAAFGVLHHPSSNFLAHLSTSKCRRVRKLVIELVMGTDMAKGGKILKSFSKCFSVEGSVPRTIPASENDAVLLLQMAMKCADLGHLALTWDLHVKWVGRLEEEFFAQGDSEKALGHSVSFLMDRDQPGCSKTQLGFFQFVVFPLFRSLVAVAPRAQPVLDAVTANYERWQSLESPIPP